MDIKVGMEAPDFELPDETGQKVRLSSFREKKVMLVFYAADFSSICKDELSCLRDDISSFESKEIQILGISVDNTHSHAAWKNAAGYNFPLLSDFWPHGAVAKLYGIFDQEKGVSKRGTFLIDENGVVQGVTINEVLEGRSERDFLSLAKISK